MTANAEARALLDQLMGVERDALLPSGAALPRKHKRPLGDGGMILPGSKKSKSCYDKDIDPLYCVWGIDVYELFVNTKSDLGPNPYKTDDAARTEYLNLPKEEQDKLGFEYRLFQKLQELVQHCDRTVHRNHEKLKRELQRQSQKRGGNDYVVDVSEEKVEEVVRAECQLEDMKKDLLKGLETLRDVQVQEEKLMEEQRKQTKTASEESTETEENAEEPPKEEQKPSQESLEKLGKLTLEKQKLLCEIASILSQLGGLEENIEVLHAKLNFVRSDTTTDKTVCEVSGNFMSARDADERIAAHYAGKQYVGWKLVRDKHQQMIQKYGRYGPPRPSAPRGNDRGPLMSHQKYQQQMQHGDRYRGHDRRGGSSSYGGGRWERGGYGGGGYRGSDNRGGYDDRRRGGYGDRDRGGYRGGGYGRR